MFDLCHACYETGTGCHNPKQHTLQRFAAFEKHIAIDDALTKDGGCAVADCLERVEEGGVFYTCGICTSAQEDKTCGLVVCHTCYSSGASCPNLTHSMNRLILEKE